MKNIYLVLKVLILTAAFANVAYAQTGMSWVEYRCQEEQTGMSWVEYLMCRK